MLTDAASPSMNQLLSAMDWADELALALDRSNRLSKSRFLAAVDELAACADAAKALADATTLAVCSRRLCEYRAMLA